MKWMDLDSQGTKELHIGQYQSKPIDLQNKKKDHHDASEKTRISCQGAGLGDSNTRIYF
jgi:hypothetical protein